MSTREKNEVRAFRRRIDRTIETHIEAGEYGCVMWTGPMCRVFGSPLGFTNRGEIFSVHAFVVSRADREKGYADFYEPLCQKDRCVNPEHLRHVRRLPVGTVRAMRAEAKAKAAEECASAERKRRESRRRRDLFRSVIRANRVIEGGQDGCHVWTGALDCAHGYPLGIANSGELLNVRSWLMRAPRAERGYANIFGESCGNPRCINPAHLTFTGAVPRTARAA